jgi:hypothetical protein
VQPTSASGFADKMTIQRQLSINLLTEDKREIQLAHDYWDGEHDGRRWIWARTVRSIALAGGLTQAELLRRVRVVAKVTDASISCSHCQKALIAESRSDLQGIEGTTYMCSGCRAEIVAEEQRIRLLQKAATRDRKLEIVRGVRAACKPFHYERISYFDAFILFGILLASDDACNKGVFSDVAGLHLCASENLCNELVGRLLRTGILTFAEDCDLYVIELEDDGSWRYYPAKMKWELAEDARGLTWPKLMHELGELLDLKEQHETYTETVTNLWWKLAYDDVLTFLREEEGKYRLPEPRIGQKTEEALRYALRKLSIPQVRRALKYAVRDAASYAMTRDIHKRQAMNSIPRNLISYVDRALSSGWDVVPVLRDWKWEESALLTLLFDRVLSTGMSGFKTLTGDEVNQQAIAVDSVFQASGEGRACP